MNPLSAQEKETLARHLSYSARVGGWFLIGMGFLATVLFLLPVFGFITKNDVEFAPEYFGALIPLLLAFFLPGMWLLRRRHKIRAQLDGDLLTGTADIAQVTGPDPYSGYTTTLHVNTPSGDQRESTLNSYAKPPWQSGERLELLFTADETRFFPRNLDLHMDLGRLPTPEQAQTNRIWRYIIYAIIGGLILIGFSIGFYESLTGQ